MTGSELPSSERFPPCTTECRDEPVGTKQGDYRHMESWKQLKQSNWSTLRFRISRILRLFMQVHAFIVQCFTSGVRDDDVPSVRARDAEIQHGNVWASAGCCQQQNVCSWLATHWNHRHEGCEPGSRFRDVRWAGVHYYNRDDARPNVWVHVWSLPGCRWLSFCLCPAYQQATWSLLIAKPSSWPVSVFCWDLHRHAWSERRHSAAVCVLPGNCELRKNLWGCWPLCPWPLLVELSWGCK